MLFPQLLLLLLMNDSLKSKSEAFRQEAAKITFSNPKYVKDGTVLTYRKDRRAPYLTSINVTILHHWDNNVTAVINGVNQKLGVQLFNLEFKVCDLLMVHWAKDWFKTYTDVPLRCPISPNRYHYKDIEIPPKDFPIPLPPGDYVSKLSVVTTKEREKIFEITINLKFV